MSDLVRDYLALPDVQFFLEHWVAFLVTGTAAYVIVVLCNRSPRRRS